MKANAIYIPESPEDASRFFRGISELKSLGSDVSISFTGPDDPGPEKYYGAGGAEELLKVAADCSTGEIFRTLISYERFSEVKEVSKPDLVAIAGGGTTLGDLRNAAGDQGLFLPFDQDIFDETVTIAELVNGGAASRWEGRYGTLRESILSIGIVAPSGEIIHSGSRSVKDVAGYEVTGFVLGCGGRCGMIDSAVLRLLPRPGAVRFIAFTGDEAGLEAVADRIFRTASPVSIEIYHGTAAELMAGSRQLEGRPLLISEMHLPVAGTEELTSCYEGAEDFGNGVARVQGFRGEDEKREFTLRVREHFGADKLLASLIIDLKRPPGPEKAEVPSGTDEYSGGKESILGKYLSNKGEDYLSWTGYFPMKQHFMWAACESEGMYRLPGGIEDVVAGNIAPGARVRFELIDAKGGRFRRRRLQLGALSGSGSDLFREVTDGEVISEISDKIYRLFDPERIVLV